MVTPGVLLAIVTFRAAEYVPGAGVKVGVAAWRVKLATATGLSLIPVLNVRALTVPLALWVNGAEYCVDVLVGSVPFVV